MSKIGKPLDGKDQFVITTVAKTVCDTAGKALSLAELENTVAAIIPGPEVDPEWVAASVDHIPKLILRVRLAKPKAGPAIISPLPKPQYRIWTEGVSEIIGSIDNYLRKKVKKPENYLLWLDRDGKKYESIRSPGNKIGRSAANLVVYLVERLGRRVPFEKVLKDCWNEEIEENPYFRKLQQNKIEQQLSALQNFCGGQFRKHLFPDKFDKGIGLKRSFADKYFIFECLC